MGWFEKQIKQRSDLDQQLFEESFFRAAGVVLGERTATKISDDHIITKQAVDDILKYYHFKPVDVPKSIKEHEAQLDHCLRHYGLMKRLIILEEGWWKDAYGAILAYRKDSGEPVAIIPRTIGGYSFLDRTTGKQVKLDRSKAELFETEAYCFYKPLPQRKLGIPDLLLYMKNCLTMRDSVLIVGAALAVTLVGMLMPRLTKALTGPVISSGSGRMLTGTAICMLCTAIASQLMTSINTLLSGRIMAKTSLGVQAAMMMRVMSLPANFFRKYSAGELTNRSLSVNQLCELIVSMVIGTSLSSLTSLLYITQIFSFAPTLVVPSLLIILITVVFTTISSIVQVRISKQQMELGAKEAGTTYAMISGVQKIKLAGAEKRFFARWLNEYSDCAELTYAPPTFIKINSVITTAIGLFSNIILFFLAVKGGVDQSSYFAFTAAYGAVMGAFAALAAMALSAGRIKPILEMAEPFLKAEPETADNKEIVTKLTGGVELNNVYFRYGENSPYIVKDLSLKIKAGEYVAIVGRTGCGKSTLMRLLLGFEKPEKGAVFYDGKDLSRLDTGSLRRNIGSVMQNGGLFQGDIYSNIVISAPHLTLEDAWAAAEVASIAEDIRAMPMGMQTLISEGQGGISGGQKQRLMIARAVAPKPKILILDEATSALDNKTQKQVSEALDKMGCTRIVIAHRLSTIRHCDRILVLEGGSIIEDGSYEELIAKNGYFAELVERQRLDIGQ
ncbi:NHLP bacteriocin export ABC transporter permease/ATPase subunit [Ruminococcus sp.]|uniref:NHLP bacteriocin export ABC transporter permease/ATPase subunit n=1 Tax=Ruminococcus sp. TaxID=41978 RepID=UPI0025CE721B|nr:NHLP bacteriocin export ABC transporter permease/ATPase subunit [Ruminococcus sp.]MBQ8967172.1 NHLP bacteriocin export ABC transporter permease/ATPase subunit [Ruminococcus sp.]